MEVVDAATAKDKADTITAAAAAKKCTKKLVRNAGPKNAPWCDLQMLDAIKAGTKEPFVFACLSCNHPNCFPAQTAKDIDALSTQIEIDNKANKALAKAGSQKKHAQKSVSQEVACMCTGSSCFLLTRPVCVSLAKRWLKMERTCLSCPTQVTHSNRFAHAQHVQLCLSRTYDHGSSDADHFFCLCCRSANANAWPFSSWKIAGRLLLSQAMW